MRVDVRLKRWITPAGWSARLTAIELNDAAVGREARSHPVKGALAHTFGASPRDQQLKISIKGNIPELFRSIRDFNITSESYCIEGMRGLLGSTNLFSRILV